MTTIDPNDERYGAKCRRLLTLTGSVLAEHVPPFVAVPAEPALDGAEPRSLEARTERYARELARQRPQLLDEVRASCGAPPWIVRSSGHEDLPEHVNAGGYLSLRCRSEEQLWTSLARVALSGYSERAIRQSEIAGAGVSPGPIPLFVQRLLPTETSPDVEPLQAPYLAPDQLAALQRLIVDAGRVLAMTDLDCEWGLETDCGFVSATSVTRAHADGGLSGRIAFGFGFASAQTADTRPNAVVYLPPRSTLQLWRGEQLRRVELRRIWLVQARPAIDADLMRTFEEVAAASERRLDDQRPSIAVTPIVTGKRSPRGPFLAAPTLAAAWRAYLELSPPEREALALVVVEQGTAVEHAGLMFQQQGLSCVAGDVAAIPADATHAVATRSRLWVGSESLLVDVELEPRTVLDVPADSQLVFPPAAPTDETTALAQLNALPLDAPTAEAVRTLSVAPSGRHWLSAGREVTSPSLFARQLERAPALPPPTSDRAAAWYRAALLLARRAAPVGELLPRFARVWRPEHERLRATTDLRVPFALAQLETRLGGATDETLDAVLSTATAAGPRAARVLSAVGALAEAAQRLPIYEDDERGGDVAAFVAALRADASAATLVGAGHDLAPPALVQLAAASAADPELAAAVAGLEAAQARMLAVSTTPELITRAHALNVEWERASARLAAHRQLVDVATFLRGSVIELYDATLKKMLEQLSRRADAALYQRYLELLAVWIQFARLQLRSPRDEKALERFVQWLQARRSEPAPRDFLIEDRNWQIEFTAAAAGRPLEYENAHALHNILHQWLLATNLVGDTLLPRRVRELLTFAARFSDRNTKILRFGSAGFEIEIPMGTHKAAFRFARCDVNVEWTEPPDCPGEEIARILAFERLLERYADWYPRYRIHFFRQQVVGTWTLFIRARRDDGSPLLFEDMRGLLHMIRFLFDAAYDFSYVENDAVSGMRESLADPAWREIFAGLIGYRAAFDDLPQHVHLHTIPMSTAVHSIARDGGVRRLLLRAHAGGWKRTLATMERIWRRLQQTRDEEKWAGLYEQLRQITLLMAALWPHESLELLAKTRRLHGGHDLLAASALRRLDLRRAVVDIAGGRRPSLSGFYGLVLRHVPYAIIAADNARELAALVATRRKAFKRAKHYLLAHYATSLSPALLKRLVADVDFLPMGATAAQESRLAAAAKRRNSRYDMTRGVDWTQLGAGARS